MKYLHVSKPLIRDDKDRYSCGPGTTYNVGRNAAKRKLRAEAKAKAKAKKS